MFVSILVAAIANLLVGSEGTTWVWNPDNPCEKNYFFDRHNDKYGDMCLPGVCDPWIYVSYGRICKKQPNGSKTDCYSVHYFPCPVSTTPPPPPPKPPTPPSAPNTPPPPTRPPRPPTPPPAPNTPPPAASPAPHTPGPTSAPQSTRPPRPPTPPPAPNTPPPTASPAPNTPGPTSAPPPTRPPRPPTPPPAPNTPPPTSSPVPPPTRPPRPPTPPPAPNTPPTRPPNPSPPSTTRPPKPPPPPRPPTPPPPPARPPRPPTPPPPPARPPRPPKPPSGPLPPNRKSNTRSKHTDDTEEGRIQYSSSVRSESRIVDGFNVTPPNKYPMIVALFVEGKPQCSGTILNKYYILTLSFCAEAWNEYPKGFYVLAGVYHVGDQDPRYLQNVSVKSTTIHTIKGPSGNSIAVIRLKRPLVWNDHVAPANLPRPSWTVLPDDETTAISVGWGLGRNQSYPNAPSRPLQEVELPLLTTESCQREDPSSAFTDHEVCIKALRGAGPCYEDWGSPLLIYNENQDKHTQIGILAVTGQGCGSESVLTSPIFVKVSKYVSWIDEAIRECNPPRAI